MPINLTNQDQKGILSRVRLVNDYFKEVWGTYEKVMIIRRKNVKRNRKKVAKIQELSHQNPQYQDNIDELSRDIGGVDTRNGQIALDPIDASSNYDNRVTNILPQQDDFKMDCNETRTAYRIEYRKRLVGLIYGYLYQAYGRGIPDGLSAYLDMRGIYRDATVVLDDLATWWNDLTYHDDETIQDYSAYHNQVLNQQRHQKYDRHAYQRMDALLRENQIERTSKCVLRIEKGGCADEFDDNDPYRLGSPSVNALFYWLTRYHSLPIQAADELYRDEDFHSGMSHLKSRIVDNVRIYQDNSYSVRFHNPAIVDKVVHILKNERASFQYHAYAHQIKQFPDTFHREALNIPSLAESLFNTNIHIRFNDTEPKDHAIIGLFQRTYRRFQDELIAQIQRGHIPDDWGYPHKLDNIRAYYQGIQTVLKSFNIYTLQNMMDYQNYDKVSVSNEDATFPEGYRHIHEIIRGFAPAYRAHDIVECYQVLGVKKGIELALQNLPVATQRIPHVFVERAHEVQLYGL